MVTPALGLLPRCDRRGTADVGSHLIVLETNPSPSLDYILVGLESPDGQRQPLTALVPIEISVELR